MEEEEPMSLMIVTLAGMIAVVFLIVVQNT
jgi:hypothetical protein